MNLLKVKILYIISLWFIALTVDAETVYITDKINAGIHEEKTLESPIVKNFSTGTKLNLIKREGLFSYVRGPKGTAGWIDNSYLIQESPASERNKVLQAKSTSLGKQLANAQQQINSLNKKLSNQGKFTPQNAKAMASLKEQHATLQQQFKEENLKTGELQIQLTELKKRIGRNNDNESLHSQIEQLEKDKKNLEIQLASALGESRIFSTVPKSSMSAEIDCLDKIGWRDLIIYLSITTILGLVFGIFIMDYFNKRRHGGFRI